LNNQTNIELNKITITDTGIISLPGANPGDPLSSVSELFMQLNAVYVSNFIQSSIPFTIIPLNQYYNKNSKSNYLKDNSTINFIPTYTINGITGILSDAIPQPTDATGSIFSFIIDTTKPVVILEKFGVSKNMITFKRNLKNQLAITLTGQMDNYLNVGEYITVPGKPGDLPGYLQYIAYGCAGISNLGDFNAPRI
jgi:hypothetical protein